MKKNLLFALLFAIPFSLLAQSPPIITWVSGSDTVEQQGVYGTIGIASSSNIPGGRENGCSWVDNSNNLWLFGGNGYSTTASQGKMDDLWKYSIATNQWTWVSGSTVLNQHGVYGTLGVPSSSNFPGGRQNSITWKDSSGNLWLFGGNGFAQAGAIGYLNDLWKYTIATNQWTWMSGSNAINQTGVYGSLGLASSSNVPGARFGCVSWIDSDVLYLFGGQIAASTRVNDLWKYTISTNQWTWISGSSISNQNGMYGTLGIASATNVPGARQAGISWIDNSNNFWMMGGYGYPLSGSASYLNDLWKYNDVSNQWTWVSGADSTFQPANYGIQGIASPTNIPGARQMSISSKDSNGDFWLFGAWGNIGPPFGRINDLWKYDLTMNEWTWVAGDNATDQAGTYGTMGVGSTSNIPGARRMGISWTDATGNFWLFGGNMSDGAGGSLLLNDLWKINTGTNTGIVNLNDDESAINIFPNPSSEKINIEISEKEKSDLIILNILGEIVYHTTIEGKKQIDISGFPKGIYVVQIGSRTKKILKY